MDSFIRSFSSEANPDFNVVRSWGREDHIEIRRRIKSAAAVGAVLCIPKSIISAVITEVVVTNKGKRLRILCTSTSLKTCCKTPDMLTWWSMGQAKTIYIGIVNCLPKNRMKSINCQDSISSSSATHMWVCCSNWHSKTESLTPHPRSRTWSCRRVIQCPRRGALVGWIGHVQVNHFSPGRTSTMCKNFLTDVPHGWLLELTRWAGITGHKNNWLDGPLHVNFGWCEWKYSNK